MDVYGGLMEFNGIYLPVNVYMANWKISMFHRYINYFYGHFQ